MSEFNGLTGYTVQAIETWPGEHTRFRKSSPFRSNFSAIMAFLAKEIRAVSGRNVVLQLAVQPGDIRKDGGIRVNARPWHPGVILTLDTWPAGTKDWVPVRYSCDRFHGWVDNLYAIALGMEALRKVERYGLGSGTEQYAGFRLPPPSGRGEHGVERRMTRDDAVAEFDAWCAYLDIEYGRDGRNETTYRALAKKLHPDVGGDPAEWAKLQEAAAVLGIR